MTDRDPAPSHDAAPPEPNHFGPNATEPDPAEMIPAKPRSRFGLTYLFIVLAIAAVGAVLFSQRTATMPSYLLSTDDAGNPITIQAAVQRATEDNKPLLVYATADWCGPCQVLKRGDLSDPEVERTLTEHYEVFILDLSDRNDPEAQRLAQMLQIQYIPTMVILRDGRTVPQGRWTGHSGSFASWIHERTDELTAPPATADTPAG